MYIYTISRKRPQPKSSSIAKSHGRAALPPNHKVPYSNVLLLFPHNAHQLTINYMLKLHDKLSTERAISLSHTIAGADPNSHKIHSTD